MKQQELENELIIIFDEVHEVKIPLEKEIDRLFRLEKKYRKSSKKSPKPGIPVYTSRI